MSDDTQTPLVLEPEDDERVALQKEFDEIRKKTDEYLNGWKRATADYQNLQKQVAREREEFAWFALERILRDFLDVADRGGAALAQVPQEGVNDHTKEWIRGVRLIFDGFTTMLASYGVTKIETVEKTFDPTCHEAVGSRHVEGREAGVVLDEARAGYLLNGRVLRVAQVIISE